MVTRILRIARACGLTGALLLLCTPAWAQNSAKIGPVLLNATTCPAVQGCVALGTQGLGSASVQVTGTYTGILTIEATVDGQTYSALEMTPIAGSTTATSTITNSTGVWQGNVGGMQAVRVRMGTYTNGGAMVTIMASSSGGTGGSSSSIIGDVTASGDKTNNTAAPGADGIFVLGAIAQSTAPTYTAGRLVLPRTDVHGSFATYLVDGSGDALTIAQDATTGATALTTGPQNMFLCTTSPSAVTTGQAGRVRGDCNTLALYNTPLTNATSSGLVECNLISTASTNSTSCLAAAGNYYGIEVENSTATVGYLRLYNASGAPTCSSSTGFIRTILIPASATGAGIVSLRFYPTFYSTGIGFCYTGGGANNDNTNGPAGTYITVLVR